MPFAGMARQVKSNLKSEFWAVITHVVRLSRQYSDVKSLQLSLGRKRKAATECDEITVGSEAAVCTWSFEAMK